MTQLTTNDRIQRVMWSADGESLILHIADGGYSLLNVSTGELTPTNLESTNPEWLFPNDKMLSPNRKQVVSSTGQSCCTGGRDMLGTKIFVANADGSNSRELSGGGSPAWSPDGNQIAFAAKLQGDTETEIYIINADGSNLHRLVANPGMDSNPVWSLDGQKLFFVRITYDSYGSPADAEIFTVNADGQNLKDVGTTDYEFSYARWSPDGQWIAFADYKSGAIFAVRPDGSERVNFGNGYNPTWSPDGTYVSYHNNWDTPKQSICISSQASRIERCFPDTVRGGYPVWRP